MKRIVFVGLMLAGMASAQVAWKDAGLESKAFYAADLESKYPSYRYIVPEKTYLGSTFLSAQAVSYSEGEDGFFLSCDQYNLMGIQGGAYVVAHTTYSSTVSPRLFTWSVYSKARQNKVGSKENQADTYFACLILSTEDISKTTKTLYVPVDQPVFAVAGKPPVLVTLKQSEGLQVEPVLTFGN